jgi:hypothetical protein
MIQDGDAFDDEPLEDDAAGDESLGRTLDTEAGVLCPHCGAPVSIALDPAGGDVQEYIEDCEVCCRPWKVQLSYDARGAADVQLEGLE